MDNYLDIWRTGSLKDYVDHYSNIWRTLKDYVGGELACLYKFDETSQIRGRTFLLITSPLNPLSVKKNIKAKTT